MSNLNVSRGTAQTRDVKKAILESYVFHYQPDLTLNRQGFLKFNSVGISLTLDIDNCVILSELNLLVIIFHYEDVEMSFTLTA